MLRIKGGVIICGLIVFLTVACSKSPQVVISIPRGFSGQITLQFGVPGAKALQRSGDTYLAPVSSSGVLTTSTILDGPPKYSVSSGEVRGYSCSIVKTGDGVAVGGHLELFVGTKEQYESYQAKKSKSEQKDTLPINTTIPHSSTV